MRARENKSCAAMQFCGGGGHLTQETGDLATPDWGRPTGFEAPLHRERWHGSCFGEKSCIGAEGWASALALMVLGGERSARRRGRQPAADVQRRRGEHRGAERPRHG